ncbi:hypothetical protein ACOSQ2_033268 [Xanthoceras sorbifolium]
MWRLRRGLPTVVLVLLLQTLHYTINRRRSHRRNADLSYKAAADTSSKFPEVQLGYWSSQPPRLPPVIRDGSSEHHTEDQEEREGNANTNGGLDNSGKTTIVLKINGEDTSVISPTVCFNIKTIAYQKGPKKYKIVLEELL